jgi:hypothetical protein
MDIHHLKQIGKIESHTIYIDSGDRDKYVFKKPSEYEVIFDTPFTNVVGLDVLDASVVPTMYIGIFYRNLSRTVTKFDNIKYSFR